MPQLTSRKGWISKPRHTKATVQNDHQATRSCSEQMHCVQLITSAGPMFQVEAALELHAGPVSVLEICLNRQQE